MRIVFMGTPEFATTILQAIHENSNHEIAGVVTATDKPSGRGQKMSQSHVKKYALRNNLLILQPENLKNVSFQKELEALEASCFVVVAFRMLPKEVWSIPQKGTINLHGSLLPKYRGAAPINWAVIHGEKKTGVTSFFINENIDTGDIILQREMDIDENDTAGDIHDRMMHLGADVVIDTLDLLEKEEALAQQQEMMDVLPSPAPKIYKKDCEIDFDKNAKELHQFIHGMSPFPGAWMTLKKSEKEESKIFKVFRSKRSKKQFPRNEHPKLITEEKKLYLNWRNECIELLMVQLEGKKRMETSQFLQGFKAEEWSILQ
jgi:methionyl-tRNA formyltransferase